MLEKDRQEYKLKHRAKLQADALLIAQRQLEKILQSCKDYLDMCKEKGYTPGKTMQQIQEGTEGALREIQKLKAKYQDDVASTIPTTKLTSFGEQ